MKFILAAGAAIALLSVPTIAPAKPGHGISAGHARGHVRNWGPRHGGRWIWGMRSPGGWGGYRPAFRGWVLPSYWIAPRFYIQDHGRYGFPAPQGGHGWSRYYDDAVLTDRDGRVIETRRGVDWDKHDEYRDDDEAWAEGEEWREDGPPPRNARGETTGAVVGGVVGGVAGAAIAGKGDRLPGAIIGGAAGAIAGAAVGRSNDRNRDRNWRHDSPPPRYHDGRGPHWSHHGGYGHGGYGGETVTTTTYRPVTTTVTTITEEWVEAPHAHGPRKRIVHKRSKLLRR